jgi:hypothetical protein
MPTLLGLVLLLAGLALLRLRTRLEPVTAA